MSGFKKFLMRGNLIDLAVAVVIGVAFNAIVTALVSDLITPLIAAAGGGKVSFKNLSFTLNHQAIPYGLVLNAALSFLIVAAVVYYLIVGPSRAVRLGRSAAISTSAQSAALACTTKLRVNRPRARSAWPAPGSRSCS